MRTAKLIAVALASAALGAVGGTGSAAADVEHVVAPGETLTSVAATDGLSIARLAAANGLSPDAQLTAGTTLEIPARGAGAPVAAGSPAASVSTGAGTYRVVSGDTLSGIAARYGTSAGALAGANGLDPNGPLLAGATLVLPQPTAAPAPAGPEPAAAPVPAGPEPTDQFVSPSEVGQIASEQDVSPSLAEAIAAQESGFNNDEVSPTGATGVMQIEPGTWRYVRSELGGRALSPASARDNVLAGVKLLHALLSQTGGNPELAAAGYYQGLGSVREHGLYGDTRRYVRAVTALRSRFGGP